MRNSNNRLTLVILALLILVVCTSIISFQNDSKVKVLETKIATMEQNQSISDAKNSETIKTLSDELSTVRSIQKKTELRQLDATSRGNNMGRGMTMRNISRLTENTDLCQYVDISIDDMNRIIDNWDNHVKNGTPFKNKGEVFIKAAHETGLNPVYILAHAAWESNWGKSSIAQAKNNYFGINAVDSDPGKAYAMGSSLDDGIIEGAKWIKKEFYNDGLTSLNSMIHNNGRGAYASDKDVWIDGISSIVNSSYRIL